MTGWLLYLLLGLLAIAAGIYGVALLFQPAREEPARADYTDESSFQSAMISYYFSRAMPLVSPVGFVLGFVLIWAATRAL